MEIIVMIPFFHGYKIPATGRYLVKTVSTSRLKTVRWVEAQCTLTQVGTSVDVNNQIVTDISELPLTK